MISTPQCFVCKHYQTDDVPVGQFRCTAFPKGIPLDIMFNRVSHTKHYQGDHGVRFERLQEETSVLIGA